MLGSRQQSPLAHSPIAHSPIAQSPLAQSSSVKNLGHGLSNAPLETAMSQTLGGNRRQKALFSPAQERSESVAALLSPAPAKRMSRGGAGGASAFAFNSPRSPELSSRPDRGSPRMEARSPLSERRSPLSEQTQQLRSHRSPLPAQRRHLRSPDRSFEGCVLKDEPVKNRFKVFPESAHYRTSSPLTWKQHTTPDTKEMKEVGARFVTETGKALATRRHSSPAKDSFVAAPGAGSPRSEASPGPKSELLFVAGGSPSAGFKTLQKLERRGLAGDAARGQGVESALPTQTALRPGASCKSDAAGLTSAEADACDTSRHFDFFEGRLPPSPTRASVRRLGDGLRPEVPMTPEPGDQRDGHASMPAGTERRLTWLRGLSPVRSNKRMDVRELRTAYENEAVSVSPRVLARPTPPASLARPVSRNTTARQVSAPVAEVAAAPLAEVVTAGRQEVEERRLSWKKAPVENLSTASQSPSGSPVLGSPNMSPIASARELELSAQQQANAVREMARMRSPKRTSGARRVN